MKFAYLLLATIALLSSCSNHKLTEETINADGVKLANLQCDAKKLQEERFKLAEDIRHIEDSVMYSADSINIPAYKAKLEKLIASKEDMHLRTKTMADSISNVLKGYYEGAYKDTADRRLLDVALTSAFESNCK